MNAQNEFVERLNSICQDKVEKDSLFKDAFELIRANTQGPVYLGGSFLYGYLIEELYFIKRKDSDIDFVVDRLNEITSETIGQWKVHKDITSNYPLAAHHVSPAFYREHWEAYHKIEQTDKVDVVELYHFERNTINKYLAGTPLTIQSILYDITEKKVFGEVGIKAIMEKTLGVNSYQELKGYAQRKGLSPKKLIKQKAKQYGFKANSENEGGLTLAEQNNEGRLSLVDKMKNIFS